MISEQRYEVVSFLKLKGGVGGTTSAIMTATGLARLGHRVLLVDADKTTKSALEWTLRIEAAGHEPVFDLAQWTPDRGTLSSFVRLAAEQRPDVRYVLVDVQPDESAVKQAAALTTLAVLPTGVDFMELPQVVETEAKIQQIKPGCPRLALLTGVPRAAGSDGRSFGRAADARLMLGKHDIPVLTTEISQDRARYADVFGQPVTDVGAYDQLVDELVDIIGSRA